jgi:hypothetical protein
MPARIINLKWNGATDDIAIDYYELSFQYTNSNSWSNDISVKHELSYGTNSVTKGGGAYSFTPLKYVDHRFRIRTVDNTGKKSVYTYLDVTLSPLNAIFISGTSSNMGDNNTVCNIDTYIAKNEITLSTATIINNTTKVFSAPSTPFLGQNDYWRILLNGVNYNCKINNSGTIITHFDCSSIEIAQTTMSNSYEPDNNGAIPNSPTGDTSICLVFLYPNTIYYVKPLQLSSIIYTDEDPNGILSREWNGNNKYFVINDDDLIKKIVKISKDGKVDKISNFSATCRPTIEQCCFVEGTKVTMFDFTEKNIEDIIIGDIVITYNETTGEQEPGEVKNIASPIKNNIVEYILSNGTIVKSTTCHPYWVIDKGWSSKDPELTKRLYQFDASQIELNDILLNLKNEEVIINNINILPENNVNTYNIQIIGNHTYYANGILVHNKEYYYTSSDGAALGQQPAGVMPPPNDRDKVYYDANGNILGGTWNTGTVAASQCFTDSTTPLQPGLGGD